MNETPRGIVGIAGWGASQSRGSRRSGRGFNPKASVAATAVVMGCVLGAGNN